MVKKIVIALVDIDAMIGGQFEKGLAQLRSVAEASPAHAATGHPGERS